MKIIRTATIVLPMLIAAGCMHNQTQANRQSSAEIELGSTATPATVPTDFEQPLNHIERADKLIGEEVVTSDHLSSGKIDNFVIDQDSGQILYAIVGIGGVLGVGETRVAVPPAIFTEAKKGMVELNVDKHKLTRAPQVTRESEKAIKTDFVGNVYGYFGRPATWQGLSSTSTATFNSARMATDLIGMTVQDSAHQDLGKVETLALNVPAGREIYIVLSPTSEMNLGNNYYALPPKAVKLSTDQKTLVGDLTRAKLANAPHFAKDDWSELSNTGWAQKVYEYYGLSAPLPTTGTLQPTGRSR